MAMNRKIFLWGSRAGPFLLALGTLASPARGQQTAEEVAKALANPNTTLGTFSFPIDFVNYGGTLPDAGGQNALKLSAQPSMPYSIAPGVNFFLRPLIPVVFSQPVPTGEGFESRGVALGDIGFDAAIGKSFPNGIVLVGGVVGSMPTATDSSLGLDQWLLGPEAAVAIVGQRVVLGALVSQSWRVGGSNPASTSVTGGQYFYTINLGGGWQIQSQPTWSYNHKAQDGDQLTFPFGTGISRTLIMGSTPWKLGLQYWYYLARPEAFGPRHQIRFSVAPVLPLPW
jgi:hypothetical protein